MSLRLRAAPAALLLCLAGCSDPYAPVQSGAYWLMEIGDGVMSAGFSPPEGAAFWFGGKDDLLKRVRSGREGPLRETERFDVQPGLRVNPAAEGEFELGFTVSELADGRLSLDYQFAWSGRPATRGVMRNDIVRVFCFLRPKEGKRYDLLMVSVNGVGRN